MSRGIRKSVYLSTLNDERINEFLKVKKHITFSKFINVCVEKFFASNKQTEKEQEEIIRKAIERTAEEFGE